MSRTMAWSRGGDDVAEAPASGEGNIGGMEDSGKAITPLEPTGVRIMPLACTLRLVSDMRTTRWHRREGIDTRLFNICRSEKKAEEQCHVQTEQQPRSAHASPTAMPATSTIT